ncbi:hypothetical protein [Ferrovibrio sp.]|uniref:hypothetical protein n=1 Tax=Ferrovibrio sp. TaxID=1917215 RepID=UPI003D0A3397
MGSSAKILVPAIGLGILAIATGGFGLAGAGAAAGAGAGTAGAGAAGAGLAGAELAGAAAGAAATETVAGGALAADALGQAAAGATTAFGTGPANPSMWSQFLSWSGLSSKQAIGLGFSGVSSAYSSVSGARGASMAEGQAKYERGMIERQALSEDIEAERELGRALAAQNAIYHAGGVDPGSGSALAVAEGAMARTSSMARLRQDNADLGMAQALLGARDARRRRALAPVGGLVGFGASLGQAYLGRG